MLAGTCLLDKSGHSVDILSLSAAADIDVVHPVVIHVSLSGPMPVSHLHPALWLQM